MEFDPTRAVFWLPERNVAARSRRGRRRFGGCCCHSNTRCDASSRCHSSTRCDASARGRRNTRYTSRPWATKSNHDASGGKQSSQDTLSDRGTTPGSNDRWHWCPRHTHGSQSTIGHPRCAVNVASSSSVYHGHTSTYHSITYPASAFTNATNASGYSRGYHLQS